MSSVARPTKFLLQVSTLAIKHSSSQSEMPLFAFHFKSYIACSRLPPLCCRIWHAQSDFASAKRNSIKTSLNCSRASGRMKSSGGYELEEKLCMWIPSLVISCSLLFDPSTHIEISRTTRKLHYRALCGEVIGENWKIHSDGKWDVLGRQEGCVGCEDNWKEFLALERRSLKVSRHPLFKGFCLCSVETCSELLKTSYC